MDLVSGIVVYFLIWWVVLFAVLPFGVRNTAETGEDAAPGTMPGAPVKAMMWRKALATTIVSAVIFAIVWWVADSGLVSLYGREN